MHFAYLVSRLDLVLISLHIIAIDELTASDYHCLSEKYTNA